MNLMKKIMSSFFSKKSNKYDILKIITKEIPKGKFILYFGKLSSGEKIEDDILDHHTIIGKGFKRDDVAICCDEFRKAAGEMIKNEE